MKISVWSNSEAQRELSTRLKACVQSRERFVRLWDRCEQAMFNIGGPRGFKRGTVPDVTQSAFTISGDDTAGFAEANSGVNYAFKNVRFIHSQLSANPPSIAVRPLTPDAEDRRKALAGDALKQFCMRQYSLQEHDDKVSLNTLIYGTGVGKVYQNSDGGDILGVDEKTGEITTEGCIEVECVNLRHVYIDADAVDVKSIRYIFEEKYYPYEEAMCRWGDKKQEIDNSRLHDEYEKSSNRYETASWHHDAVKVYEYWEKGLPHTGMLGRYGICLEDGTLLEPMTTNPHQFAPPSKEGKMNGAPARKRFPVASLPFVIFTDIDVPGTVWGMSALMYALDMQNVILDIDSAAVDNVYAHSVARLMIPESADVQHGAITNSPMDIIKYTGNIPPTYMAPMPVQSATIDLRNTYMAGLDAVFGVNESMFGQQSRETSGFSMQYATNQGNMIRRRLFNKFTMFVEETYKHIFNLARTHWSVERVIHVLGDENTMNAVSFVGTDIDGGFDLVGEYGTNFSLDPVSRRQEILNLYPILKEAGVEPSKVVEMLKLNDFNRPSMEKLAEERQKEIFYRMILTNNYIPPVEMQDHKNMLTYAYYYVMTAEYRDLPPSHSALIRQHIVDREAILKALAAPPIPASGAPVGAPITAPIVGMDQPNPGMQAEAPPAVPGPEAGSPTL